MDKMGNFLDSRRKLSQYNNKIVRFWLEDKIEKFGRVVLDEENMKIESGSSIDGSLPPLTTSFSVADLRGKGGLKICPIKIEEIRGK